MLPATPPSSSDPALASYDSPIGRLTLAARGGALVGLWAAGQRFFGARQGVGEAEAGSSPDVTEPARRAARVASAGWDREDAEVVCATARWLDGYFAGLRPSPDPIPIQAAGTAFQMRVWEAMDAIPYGQTWTYGQLAMRLRGGAPASARAVGAAVGRNPLLLIRPCHRVVATTGRGGYAAGGSAKAWLLAHEAATASSVS